MAKASATPFADILHNRGKYFSNSANLPGFSLASPCLQCIFSSMTHLKSVCLPLVLALFASGALPASGASVKITVSDSRVYRQYASGLVFREGSFAINLADGYETHGCSDIEYFPPSPACALGATGFVSGGSLDPDLERPDSYYEINSIVPAAVIEPYRDDQCFLHSAPASDLPRPLFGFVDRSASVYYNISPGSISIKEYEVTGYNMTRKYDRFSGDSMRKEIVPGAYFFSFPALKLDIPNPPELKVSLALSLYPMVDGYHKIGNVKQGIRFVDTGSFSKRGYIFLDKNSIQEIKWEGVKWNQVVSTDKLYFSIRYLRNPNDPTSEVEYENEDGIPQAIFPEVLSGADPRVLLKDPLVSRFMLPPYIRSGQRGVVELEYMRGIAPNSITSDTSSRKIQLPIFFVDQYREYAKKYFGSKTNLVGIFEDFDGDGYNNLVEWVLGSRADDERSIPPKLTPAPVPENTTVEPPIPAYYGFAIWKKHGLIPAVVYAVERSVDRGKTWSEMKTNANWRVINDNQMIRVESLTGAMPPGTGRHLYRGKIRLAN